VYLGDQRPEIFFEALERLIGGSVSTPPPVEVVFAGTGCDETLKARLTAYPAASRVCEFTGRVPPLDALRLQREADALLLFNCTAPTPDEGTLSFPAKTFEYLNAGRPILAVPRDPGGWGDRLLETTGAGITADSAESAAAILARWVEERNALGSLAYHGKAEEVTRYSQPRQAAALAGLLDRAVEARSP
jgi:hypothetical protein